MKQEQIGAFIKKLRESRNMTQEELAAKMHVGREAVSKWERGKTTPDVGTLTSLSTFFEVSINEILAGEYNTDKNITLELYKDKTRLQSNLKTSLIIIAVIILASLLIFFAYYFKNYYKSTHIYLIKGSSENFEIPNGIFVKTAERMYLNLGYIKTAGKDITKVTLYYQEGENDNLIVARNDPNISLKDYAGYEEYFEIPKIDNILGNLYLRIEYDNIEEDIKLEVVEDYINDNFILKKFPPIIKEKTLVPKRETPKESLDIIKNITKSFTKNGEKYIQIVKKDNLIKEFTYVPNSANMINLSIYTENGIIEKYNYFLDYEDLTYEAYKNNHLEYITTYFKDSYRCDFGSCTKIEEKKAEFWNELNTVLNFERIESHDK